jgi:hypothetical protein
MRLGSLFCHCLATAVTGTGLEEWIDKLNQSKPPNTTTWRLDRSSESFLQLVCEKYERASSTELHRDFRVIFDGEQGVDRGALTREFFYICFELTMQNKFKDTALMIGERGHILPEASAEHLIHAYEFIGKMIAHAVRLGCHGFPGLSPALQSYIVYGQGLVNLEDFSPPVSIH